MHKDAPGAIAAGDYQSRRSSTRHWAAQRGAAVAFRADPDSMAPPLPPAAPSASHNHDGMGNSGNSVHLSAVTGSPYIQSVEVRTQLAQTLSGAIGNFALDIILCS